MFEWFANTLRTYPEIAIFISLALGYYFGSFTYKGLGLGAVTATLSSGIDVTERRIDLELPEDEIARRIEAYEPPAAVGNGVLGKYAKLVSSASEGAVTR